MYCDFMSHLRPGWIISRGRSTTVARYCPLEALTKPSRIALTRTCLTSKFRWNPKPLSSQNASC
ncbi:hypothetical protein DVH24_015970 [Malus domestica]|uniref:Uncharacterized protein n=1 Tax=Malus domestica TaxID=3750 RepID=A0A498JJF2_MALDO|nr:hypothetical protein DVH24_015970 [Malus domestica]